MRKLLLWMTTASLLTSSLTGCATNEKTRWTLIVAPMPVGAALGAATAPDGEKKSSHAGLWAIGAGLAGAVIGQLFYSDKKELKEKAAKIQSLENDILKFKNPPTFEIKPKSDLGRFVYPKGYSVEKSGYYRFRKADDWLTEGNKKYHYDMVILKSEKNDKSK